MGGKGGRVAGWCGTSLFRMPSNGSSVQLLLHATLSFKCPCVRCKRRRPFYVPRRSCSCSCLPLATPPLATRPPLFFSALTPLAPPSVLRRWPVDFNGCSSPRGVPAVLHPHPHPHPCIRDAAGIVQLGLPAPLPSPGFAL